MIKRHFIIIPYSRAVPAWGRVRGVNVFNITLSGGDKIIPLERGEFEMQLKDSHFYRSRTGKMAFHISFLKRTEEFGTDLLRIEKCII